MRAVGVAAGLGGELHGIPVQAHQLSERFTAAVLDGAAGGLDEVNDVRGHLIQTPHQRALAARGDRAMAVLAHGI